MTAGPYRATIMHMTDDQRRRSLDRAQVGHQEAGRENVVGNRVGDWVAELRDAHDDVVLAAQFSGLESATYLDAEERFTTALDRARVEVEELRRYAQ